MADVLPLTPTLDLIVTNPNLSGRSLKAMILARAPDGVFGVDPAYPDVALGDGQTTIIHIPLGARLVISEAHEPAMAPVMAAHPAVTGRPAPMPAAAVAHAPVHDGQLSPAEEDRLKALSMNLSRTVAENAELAALTARGRRPLMPAEEARRVALAAQATRTPAEQTELDALQARVT